jgi:hypothetical protein
VSRRASTTCHPRSLRAPARALPGRAKGPRRPTVGFRARSTRWGLGLAPGQEGQGVQLGDQMVGIVPIVLAEPHVEVTVEAEQVLQNPLPGEPLVGRDRGRVAAELERRQELGFGPPGIGRGGARQGARRLPRPRRSDSRTPARTTGRSG